MVHCRASCQVQSDRCFAAANRSGQQDRVTDLENIDFTPADQRSQSVFIASNKVRQSADAGA
jgi:hypothetical protein